MSFQRPGSWSFTKTLAEMCIAETSTNPSLIPAAARHCSTSSVMSMISCRFFVLKVRYVVWVRMGSGGFPDYDGASGEEMITPAHPRREVIMKHAAFPLPRRDFLRTAAAGAVAVPGLELDRLGRLLGPPPSRVALVH